EPGSTKVLAFTARPPTVSRPSVISFWTWLRDRPLRSAAQRSALPRGPSDGIDRRRMSATMCSGPCQRGPDARRQEQDDREADPGVGHVEGVPAQGADPSINEVHDVAQPQSIDGVADRATEEQSEGDRDVLARCRA